MSEAFQQVASIDYPILDADAHVNEPPDLWQSRVQSRLRDRAPKVLRTEDGDVWSFDDGKRLRPLGLTATAGLSYLQFKPQGYRYEEIRPGSFEPRARLADLDADGIWAQVLYPSVTLAGARTYADDRELQTACVRAYNEWLAEFCAAGEGRLIGQAIIPTTGVADAVAELRWGLDHGLKGAVIAAYPNGTYDDPGPSNDPFWGLAQEARVPLGVHIGSFNELGLAPGKSDMSSVSFMAGAGASKAGSQTIPVAAQLVFSGVPQRFPGVLFVLVEANIGWIPTVLEQLDDMFLRYRWFSGAHEWMKETPSRVFHRSFAATFMVDTIGIELRHHMNVDHLLWSTDYPHTGSDWPNHRITIERLFRGVPQDEVKKMLHGNCKRLYGLDQVPDRLP
ncbi:MAG TPA: amidohydrolase family protein [Candidatus Binatia bacterium]|nr:amidohydrolase family protein [Candidatus Binatia bacterium]